MTKYVQVIRIKAGLYEASCAAGGFRIEREHIQSGPPHLRPGPRWIVTLGPATPKSDKRYFRTKREALEWIDIQDTRARVIQGGR